MRRRLFLLLLLLFASLLVFQPGYPQAADSQPVQLMINGSLEAPDVPAMIKQGRTLVPLRFISEQMGAHVEWLPQTKEINIYKGERLLNLRLGSNQIKVNGVVHTMDVAPILAEERTMVPVRFVSEYLGLPVGWMESTRTVIISDPIQVYVNGEPFSEGKPPLRYKDQIYLPIFHLAERLQIEVKEDSKTDTYVFLPKQRSIKQNGVQISSLADEPNVLPSSEIIIVDGVKMAPFKWIDPLLGTTSAWDVDNKLYIRKQHASTDNGKAFHDDGNVPAEQDAEDIVRLPKLLDYSIEGNTFRFELSEYVAEPHYFFLEEPHRLVVDLPYVLLDGRFFISGGYVEQMDHELVERLRISQFSSSPYTVRIVLDLKRRVDVSVQSLDKLLEINLSKRIPLVVIDAGHGGKDPGALGQFSQEKEVNLGIITKLYQLLEQDPDVRVLATRLDDTYPTLDDRVLLANQINADLFISVHANANNNQSIGGTETYIYFHVDDTFGKIVHKHLVEATGLEDRGLKRANFKVLRETRMPSVLVEVAFISNPYEEKLLNDPAFQKRVANGLYKAIKEYAIGK